MIETGRFNRDEVEFTMFQIGFRIAATSLAIALVMATGADAQGHRGGGGGGRGGGGGGGGPAVRSAPAPMARPAPAPMARPAPAPMARPAAPPPQMRQVAPGPRQIQAPRQFQAAPRQMAPQQMSPRHAAPSQQRVAPRFAGPRDGGPKGELRRGVSPRQGIASEQGKAGSRAAERRELRQQPGGKSNLTGRENARQRAVERRQELIERKQRATEERKQRAIDRREALGKDRQNLKGREALGKERDRLNAGQQGANRTVGRRTDGRPDRDLVRRGKGDRQWMLRNRSLADLSARTPASRALAQATFGGRFADRFHRGDRRDFRFRHIHVIGWFGPLFWPYAYDDFVDYTFWPYAYDAFWPYAYDDVYEGFFGPYAVGGPAYYAEEGGYAGGGYASGGVRTGSRTAARGPADGGGAMAQICTGETSGLTDWPIERIAEVVNPDDTQRVALNELRDAAARAVEQMRSACPGDLPSTPAGRMAAMRQRLEAMRAAVQIVRPALERFYESLSDEQRARFNALEPDQAIPAKAGKSELSQVCSAAVTRTNAAPTARIQQALRLSPEQRSALDNLDGATAKAAEILAANCPTDEMLTPPGRLAGMERRLDAMLQALDVVQPALTAFYNSLSDEQKARFNQLGTRQQASR